MQEKKVNFIMAIHCHQPVGNFEWVFEDAYKRAYLPFIQELEQHPKIKLCVHYSGCLWDWIIEHHPEFIERVRKMVKAGQIEVIGGGYYEPILPLIPEEDKSGQIEMMNKFIRKDFGAETKGAWLAERVWEPYLAKSLSKAGIAYTVLDDSHFKLAGLKDDDIFGYYVTEEDGNKLFIFPTLEKLRYLTPFRLPQESIEYLRGAASGFGRAVVLADDGEKFGIWPGTHKWVYEEKWLHNFFSALEENLSWISLTTFSRFIEDHPPLGRIYIPCASYKEMLEWSGGYFRNFLVKYAQTNIMQKKMLFVSQKVNAIPANKAAKKNEALRHLYQGQCNCSYWHGVFGGLYIFHLRSSVFKHLIIAEHIADKLRYDGNWLEGRVFDINCDGWDEVLVNSKALNAYFDPHYGGALFELDYKNRAANITNVISRKPEAYHARLKDKPVGAKAEQKEGVQTIHDVLGVKDENLVEFLYYDWYERYSLLDHFLGDAVTLNDFYKCRYHELGDFVNQPYDYAIKKDKGAIEVKLEREGYLWKDHPIPLKLGKTITFNPRQPVMEARYCLENLSGKDIDFWFGVEFNFSIDAKGMEKIGQLEDIEELSLQDQWQNLNIRFKFDGKTGLWHFPVETVSESESGIEKTHQGLCLLFHWKYKLKPGEKCSLRFTQEICEY